MVEYKQNVSDQNNSNHGEGKRMADGVNSYLLFFSAGFHFLLPLSCVKRVTDMKERDPEMALADFSEFLEAEDLSGLSCYCRLRRQGDWYRGRGSDRSCTGGGRKDIFHS